MKQNHWYFLAFCALIAVLLQTTSCISGGEPNEFLRGGSPLSSEETPVGECLPDGFSGIAFVVQMLALAAFGYGARQILPRKNG